MEAIKKNHILSCAMAMAPKFGRAWPLGAVVRPGIVPSWSQLLDGFGVPCIVSSKPHHASFLL